MYRLFSAMMTALLVAGFAVSAEPAKIVAVGSPAPEFKIKDASGKVIDLAELTAEERDAVAGATADFLARCG